ncbi:uncharacterized protein LOC111272489 [Varroa jacobsoni]|uniref:uncharacterized protein LOC111272489 n=1 Tax=Varroa jacobsoni TaxID=62625 RepID=UPI000BF87505|nr:uncharacterized protein LOC111272489 [Varroa jacobsoni]
METNNATVIATIIVMMTTAIIIMVKIVSTTRHCQRSRKRSGSLHLTVRVRGFDITANSGSSGRHTISACKERIVYERLKSEQTANSIRSRARRTAELSLLDNRSTRNRASGYAISDQ